MNRVCIRINGHEYNMCAEESKEHMIMIANFVDEKMQEVSKSNPRLSTAMAAVLTSVNIANELFKKRDEIEAINRKIKGPLEDLESANEKIESLQAELQVKQSRIEELEKQTDSIKTSIEEYVAREREISQEKDNLSGQLLEKDQKLRDAEEIVTDFQNRLYQMQMKIVKLEKKE